MELIFWIEAIHSLLQQKGHGALIYAMTLRVRDIYKTDRDGRMYAIVELLDAIVYICRQHRIAMLKFQSRSHLKQRSTQWYINMSSYILAVDSNYILHNTKF